MSKQADTNEHHTNIRNGIFNKTGLKVAVDDPVVQLIKAQQDFIEESYALVIKDLELKSVDIINSIDSHNNEALKMLDAQIAGLSELCTKVEVALIESSERESKSMVSISTVLALISLIIAVGALVLTTT